MHRSLLLLLPTVSLAGLVHADVRPPSAASGAPRGLGGDSPPAVIESWSGKFELAFDVAVAAHDFVDTFELDDVPDGAEIQRTYLVTGGWFREDELVREAQVVFNGRALGPVAPTSTDPADVLGIGWDLAGYSIDVTQDVPGNGTYPFAWSVEAPRSCCFERFDLIVVYSHPSLSLRRIDLALGAESLRSAASTLTFPNGDEGNASVHLFLHGGDDVPSLDEESISFNGEIQVGGPGSDLFSADGRDESAHFVLPVTTVSGPNSLRVITGEDWMGWHFAALVAPLGPFAVEPTTWGRVKGLYYR